MSQSFLLYFLSRLGFYLKEFFKTYFIYSFDWFNTIYFNIILELDRKLGVSTNYRYFLVPLWQEYSFPAYLLSIPIRALKILGGGACLVIFSILFWCVYLGWLGFLVVLIIKTLR